MAVLTITPAEVTAAVSGVTRVIAQWGTTVAAGQAVYQSTTSTPTGKWLLMIDTSAEPSGVGVLCGIALSGGADGQWGVVAIAGPVTLEASSSLLERGTHYYVGATAGGIDLRAGVATGQKVTDMGYATTEQILLLAINATGLVSL